MSREVPVIVLESDIVNQSQNPGATSTIVSYTPTANSFLRVSTYLSVPAQSLNFSSHIYIRTTDASGNPIQITGAVGNSGDGVGIFLYVKVLANTLLHIDVDNSASGFSPITFNSWTAIEEL
jgi:hypothetical protein